MYGHYIDTDIAKKVSRVEESKAKTVKLSIPLHL